MLWKRAEGEGAEEVGGEGLCFPGMGTYVCKEGGREGEREGGREGGREVGMSHDKI